MPYYTTVKAITPAGNPTKAEVFCGGSSKGFTDDRSGSLTFETYSNDRYDVTIKKSGYDNGHGSVRGGDSVVVRLGS